MSEAAWNKAFTHGSKAMQDRLKKVHASNPKFQAWLKSSGHAAGTSVKQASKEVKPSERVKSLQAKSTQAYGATKGVKVGGEFGSGEMRDTIKPLTRDQWSKVHAAERAAKAAAKKSAEKTSKPAAVKKPLTQDERMAAIRRALVKAKAKDRFDVPTVDPDDIDHDDLMDVHQSLHVRRGYNEETKPDASMAMTDTLKMKMISDKDKRTLGKVAALMAAQKNKDKKNAYVRQLGLNAMKAGEVDPARGHSPTRFGREVLKKEQFEQIDEVTKKEAEQTLGGPVKEKPKMPPGKQPAGYRYVRGLARKAMKAGLKKEEVEVNEAIKDAADVGEYDYEGDMAKSQLRSILANAKRLHDMLEDTTNLPEWVQSKITLAEDYILTAANYMEGEMNEEVESVNEGATHWEYSGTVNGKDYTITVPRGADLSDHLGHKKIQRENPHLEPHEVKAVADTSGEDEEHVEVEHGGKKYTHRVTNNQEPRMVYSEEVEQVDEKINLVKAKMGDVVKDFYKSKAPQFKGKSMAKRREMAVAAKLGAEREAGMREEVEQIDEQSPAEIKAKYYHDQFDKVKPVKAYDKKGKLVGRYRSMNHAKQMKPGHTYKVEEEIALDEMDKSQPSSSRGVEGLALGKKADPVKTDKVKSDALKLLQKQYKKVKEKVVTEAEGKVAVTSKEKELAAHHGDKTRITYGDVIKARLKSAAAKKMGK